MEDRIEDLEQMVERHEFLLMLLIIAMRTVPDMANAMAGRIEQAVAKLPYGSPFDKPSNKAAVVEMIARLRGEDFG